MLAFASSSVSPSETHPGISRHSATKTFSSGTSRKTSVKVISGEPPSPITNSETWLLSVINTPYGLMIPLEQNPGHIGLFHVAPVGARLQVSDQRNFELDHAFHFSAN